MLTGGTSSDAESASGSPSESEDEDASDSKMLENPSDTKSDSPDAEFEEVKSGFALDGYPKLVDVTKRLSCSDASTVKPEFDDEDDEDPEPMIAEGAKSDDDEDEPAVPGNEIWENRNYRKRLKLKHLHNVDGERDKSNSFTSMNNIADMDQVKQMSSISKAEEENDDNNNSNADGNYEERDTDNEDRCTPTPEDLQIFPPAYTASLPPSHVTFEALQNTRVAVAQHVGLTRCPSDPEKLQELAAILHQQYILQMKIIQQRLQEQMETAKLTQSSSPERTASDENEDSSVVAISPSTSTAPHNVPISLVVNRPSSPSSLSILTPPKPSRTPTPIKREPNSPPPASQPLPSSTASHTTSKMSSSSSSPPLLMGSSQLHQQPVSLPPCSISSSFASSIITNLDPPPSPSEPNSLEILTKHTQEILDNASQGLLANNLADELAFRKGGVNGKGGSSLSPYDSKNGGRNEPFFKHRCRYCGKVFGSDSALQIHIRSHTGERPFKCNVCGSRFTTKGNLKVHFQRHTSKFPHIKMNPHPIPEHLDKFHPPLLAQMGGSQHQTLPPGLPTSHAVAAAAAAGVANIPISSPGHPQPAFPVATTFPPTSLSHLYRSSATHPNHAISLPTPPPRLPQDALFRPLTSYSLFGGHIGNGSGRSIIDQDQPENLCKPATSTATNSSNQSNHSSSPTQLFENGDQFKEDSGDEEVMQTMSETSEIPNEISVSEEGHEEAEDQHRSRHTSSKTPPDMDSGSGDDTSLQEQPENLSNKSRSEINDLSLDSRKCYSRSSNPSPRPFLSDSSNSSDSFDRYLSRTPQPPLSNSASLAAYANDVDPSKDPSFVYANFLPQPGSNDNSWENLIEIDKTSETSKLQELVDNIGHKLTDPNECVICHRILSCKSALQMHYRTHTGERPFRCKLCRRSFTTKGNLKTHMSVHRVKPPVRVHHQCPVCHKRFTNSLILEQHIRLHTGDPTDLTLEQIQASEIREYFPGLNNAAASISLPPPPSINFNPLTTSAGTNTSTTSLSHPSPSGPLQLTITDTDKESGANHCDTDKNKYKEDDSRLFHHPLSQPSPSTTPAASLAALENHIRTLTTVCSRGADLSVVSTATTTTTTTTTPGYQQSFLNSSNSLENGSLAGDINDDKSRAGSRSPAFSEPMSPQSRTSVPSPTISTTPEEVLNDSRCSPTEAGTANGGNTLWSPLDLTPKSSGSPSLATTNNAAAAIYTTSGYSNYNHVNTNTNGSCSSSGSAANNSAVFVFSANSTPSSRNTSPLISSVLTSPFNPLGLAVASSGRRVLASSTIIHHCHSPSV